MFSQFEPVSFTIKVVGELSGEEFAGEFKTRRLLRHGEQLEVDRIRRRLLGEARADMATPRVLDQANVFAELTVRIVKAPKWWEELDNGMGLYDDNVVREVHKGVLKAEADCLAEINARAEAAKKQLAESKPA